MDHSMHNMMDHGGHNGHGDMDIKMCKMSMTFTWDYKDLCVIFKWWHIKTKIDFIITLIAIIIISALFEGLRAYGRYIVKYNTTIRSVRLPVDVHTDENENEHEHEFRNNNKNLFKKIIYFLTKKIGGIRLNSSKHLQGVFYAFQVFYSFFLMLVFMTYNGWIMLAVVFGAYLGYIKWGNSTELDREMSCH